MAPYSIISAAAFLPFCRVQQGVEPCSFHVGATDPHSGLNYHIIISICMYWYLRPRYRDPMQFALDRQPGVAFASGFRV